MARKIKAWALICNKTQDYDLGVDSHGRKDWDTCFDIFTTRKYALAEKTGVKKEFNRNMMVVPCTISYSLPTPSKRGDKKKKK